MNAITKRPVIALTPVVSSQLASIGHCAETNTLAIQFTGKAGPGHLYHYQNFTSEQFAAFKGAESVGKHFYAHIKPFAEKHPYQKIEAAPVVISVDGQDADRARLQGLADQHLKDARSLAAAPAEPLPGGMRYSTTTFKDNGEPILLNADGSRSIFCDVDE